MRQHRDKATEHAPAVAARAHDDEAPAARSQTRRAATGTREHAVADEPLAFGDAVNAGIHGGQALPDGLRRTFEASLGTALGGVRVHDDPGAHAASAKLGARAYAVGQDVFMGAGSYAPHRPDGAWLLAHEVAHTVQQRGAAAVPMAKLAVGESGDASEREADAAAHAMVAGTPTRVSSSASMIRRFTDDVTVPATPQHGDSMAMARDMRGVLEARLRHLQASTVRPVDERHGAPQINEQADPVRRESLRREAAQLQVEIDQLRQVRNDTSGAHLVNRVAQSHGMDLEHRHFDTAAHADHEDATLEGATLQRRATLHQHDVDGTDVQATATTRTGVQDGRLGRVESLDTTTRAPDGFVRRNQSTHARGVGIEGDGLQYRQADGHTRTVTRPDGTVAQRGTTDERTAAITGDHATLGRQHATTREDTDATGHVTASGRTTEGHGGLAYGEDGEGVTLGGSHAVTGSRRAADHDGETGDTQSSHQASVGGDATITNHGASGTGTASGSLNAGPLRTSGSIGAGGGYHVDIVPIEHSSPPKVQLVTRVDWHASLGGSVGVDAGPVAVSAGADGSRTHTVTYRHELTPHEADSYLRNVQLVSTGGTASADPELRFMSRIYAAHGIHDTTPVSAASDPAAAREMAVGSSVEVSDVTAMNVHGSVSAGAGGYGGGISGSHGRTTTRMVRVAHTPTGIEIHLEYTDATTNAASANARVEGIAASVGRSSANSDGREVTIQLDPASPTYDRDYARVMGAHTREAALALAQELHGSFRRQQSASTTTDVAAGVADSDGNPATGASGQTTHTRASDLTVADGHLYGSTTGTTDERGDGNILGHAVVRTEDSSTATANLDEHDEQTVDVERTRTDSSPIAPFQHRIDERIAREERQRGTRPPGATERILRALQTSNRELDHIHFSDAEIPVLASRAANAHDWLNALPGGLIGAVEGPWNHLGAQLRSPHPDPELAEIDPAAATKIARGQAITDFVSSVGSRDGIAALRTIAAGGAHAIGTNTQWPAAISERAAPFHQLEGQVEGAEAHYRTLTDANRVNAIRMYAGHIGSELEGILAAIRGCSTFRDSMTKVATLDMVQDVATRNTRAMNAALSNAPAADASAQATETPTAQERLSRALGELRTFKSEELRHWHASQDCVHRANTIFGNPNELVPQAIDELIAIGNTYEAWMAALHEAETAIAATHADPAMLQHLHPNPSWSIQLLHDAQRTETSIGGTSRDLGQLPAQWLAAVSPEHH